MIRPSRNYQDVYQNLEWAYGQKPDPQLIQALQGVPRGRAVDLGGGQGRHAIALAKLGFEVELVDNAPAGLEQAAAFSRSLGLDIAFTRGDVVSFRPAPGLQVAVASLLFYIPGVNASLRAAARVGAALKPGGLFYVSLPGFTPERKGLAGALIDVAGCKLEWMVKHVVTSLDRPRLQVSRRNETRALGVRVDPVGTE